MPSKSKNGQTDEPEMINKEEAAELLTMNTAYVGVLADKNPILAAGVVKDKYPGSKIPRWRITKEAVEKYLEWCKTNGKTPRTATTDKRYGTVVITPEQRDQINAFLATIGIAPLGPIFVAKPKAPAADGAVSSDQAPSDQDAEQANYSAETVYLDEETDDKEGVEAEYV